MWVDANGVWHDGDPGDAPPRPSGGDTTTRDTAPGGGGGTYTGGNKPGEWWGRLGEFSRVADAPPPTPPPTATGAPSGRPSNGIMDWGPQFHAPTWTPPDPFSYAGFAAPTAEEAANRPGYRFAAEEGKKALETSQAAAGLYRTGGSLKDLYSWADKFATQNYNNVFGQDLSVYTTNRNNAAQNWLTNYNMSRDAYDRQYQSALAEFAPQNQYALLDFDRQWKDYQAQLDAMTTLAGIGG